MNYQINLEIDISRLEIVSRDKNIYIEDYRAIDSSYMSRRFVNIFNSNKFDDFEIKTLRDWLLVMKDKLNRNVDHFVQIIANRKLVWLDEITSMSVSLIRSIIKFCFNFIANSISSSHYSLSRISSSSWSEATMIRIVATTLNAKFTI